MFFFFRNLVVKLMTHLRIRAFQSSLMSWNKGILFFLRFCALRVRHLALFTFFAFFSFMDDMVGNYVLLYIS